MAANATTTTIIGQADSAIQKELDIIMNILEENMGKLPEGEYLRGMNALGSLHRQKREVLRERRRGAMLGNWMTLDEIEEEDEELYDEIMELADDIVGEVCGDDSSIYTDDQYNLVHRGDERETFQTLLDYKPEEGTAGYETSPMVLHHAIQVILSRLFADTIHELDIVRPVSCQCGWRGPQGNWDKHTSNKRHERWVNAERERQSAEDLEDARRRVVARREPGIVYIDEMHCTPETQIATAEAIAAAEANGDRVVFAHASMSAAT